MTPFLPMLCAGAAPTGGAPEGFWNLVETVWNYELLPTGALQLSVGKVLLGLVGLAAALLVARRLARAASRLLRARVSLAAPHIDALEKGLFYTLAAVFVLTILSWLSIPLTVFAFLGGAVAIGIGFGTQALMNNFISGLILLMERGIRVGDIIEVDGFTGRVTKLGSRCSQIRKADGVDVLVPNSTFVQKNVVNWTLSDPHHRYDFTVGFAYGADTGKILELLQSILTGHPDVLADPAPAVFFEAFGDSALVFHLYYWVNLDRCNPLQVGSDLRLRLNAAAQEAGLQMPFPQRDLQLRGGEPLTVRVETAPLNPQ
jgi:small-conductance mechanosensitive channel